MTERLFSKHALSIVLVCTLPEARPDPASTPTRRIVSVCGGSRCTQDDPDYQTAHELGAALASAGFAVATGGYDGTMEAVSRGAHSAGGHVIGVLAKVFSTTANSWVRESILVPRWEDRLMKIISLGDAYIACPGGTGTLVDLAVAWEMINKRLLTPRPLIALGEFWRPVIERIESADPTARGVVHLAPSVPDAIARLQELLP